MPDTARLAPRHIRGHLRSASAVSALVDEIERREALLQKVRSLLPAPLCDRCRQAACNDGLLVLSVESPAWVSRFRLYSPRLLDALRQRDVIVNDCQVRALPARPVDTPEPPARRPAISGTAAAHLVDAAACVADAALAESLTRLAARCLDPS
ncbi:MAG: DciA family protein [Thiohalocapsa sp.]|jgi:hypothetical protein